MNQPARLLVDDLAEPPAFQLVNTNLFEFDDASQIQLLVMRIGPTNAAATVEYSLTAGTAVPGTDYEDTSGTLQFAPGEDALAIEITIPQNSNISVARDFFVELTNSSAGTPVNNRSRCRVTLMEGSSEVSFAVAAASLRESAGIGTIDVIRSATETVTGLALDPIDDTAARGQHYELLPSLVQFKEGETEQSVNVVLLDDAEENPDRTFTLGVAEVVGGALGSPASSTVTILDDDVEGRPGLGINWVGSSGQGVNKLFRDSQGRMLVGGGFVQVNGTSFTNLVRLLPSGDVDPSFNPGTGPDAIVFAIAEDADGKILVGGQFRSYNGTSVGNIVRLNDDGSIDETFAQASGFNNMVERIEVLPDGRILAGGFFSSYQSSIRKGVAIINSDGSLDESFEPATNDLFRITGHGAFNSAAGIYVIGEKEFNDPEGTNVVLRLTPDGSRDLSFEARVTGASRRITGLAVQPDGKVLISGLFESIDNTPRGSIARLNTDGSLDSTFDPGTGADAWVFRIRLQPDGKVVLVGQFETYDGVQRKYLARVNPDGSLDTTFDMSSDLDADLNAVEFTENGTIQVGGRIRRVDGIQRTGLATFANDGSLWLTVPMFLSVSDQVGDLELTVNVEPEFDVRLLQSEDFGIWNPVATNRTPRRVLQFTDEIDPTSNGFFQAERLDP